MIENNVLERKPERELKSCRCCQSANIEMVIDLGMQPWGNDYQSITTAKPSIFYPLEAFFCHDCTMVQLGYTVPKEVMFVAHNYLSGVTKSLRQHFVTVHDQILERTEFKPNDYILDIGGNDGTFLSIFQADGIKVINVDSGKKQAELSKQNNVRCLNQFFNQETAQAILASDGPAKVIHGSGVFFHLEELQSVFEGIKLLLAPDGLVVAQFIYLPAMVQNGAFDQIYHEHLLYYTLTSFDRFLARHGLTIYDAELSPIHGGSCIAFITHKETATKTERILELLAQEEENKFNEAETYRNFEKEIRQIREKLTDIVSQLQQQGKKIHALGAPVKGSTIIHYCGFTQNVLECGVEVNPLKCQTYFPGTQIPVYHQDETASPDAYLLLSWNFKDEILSKLQDFRAQGGQVIVPIPQPELI